LGVTAVSGCVLGKCDFQEGGVDKAYALRRANDGGIEKANVVLDEAAKLFPTEWSIQYNFGVLLRPTGPTGCRSRASG
jgi:Flp pilus assembly protein TadD